MGLGQHPVAVAHQLLDAVIAERDAEVVGRHILELVRLVHDEGRAARDHLAERAVPHRRIGAQQVVVHDHDVRLGGALAHLGHEAVVVARALRPQTRLGLGRDLAPERQILRQIPQLGAVAGGGGGGPLGDDRQEHRALRVVAAAAVEQRRRVLRLRHVVQPVQAQVVRAAFHQRRREAHAQRRGDRGEVLEVDLLLQVLGAGGDQHALAAQDGGNQVGQRLARAGAGLGEDGAAGLQHVGDGLGHQPLPLARLEARPGRRQRALGGERGRDHAAQADPCAHIPLR